MEKNPWTMDQATLEYIKNAGQDILSKVMLDDQRRGRVPKKKLSLGNKNREIKIRGYKTQEWKNRKILRG